MSDSTIVKIERPVLGVYVHDQFIPLTLVEDLWDADRSAIRSGAARFVIDSVRIRNALTAAGYIEQSTRGSSYLTDIGDAWAKDVIRSAVAYLKENSA